MRNAIAKRRGGDPRKGVWETPDWLYRPLNELLRFDLDAAASRKNAKCARFYDERMNGLAQPWDGRSVWCNPPYGLKTAPTGDWVFKGLHSVITEQNQVTLLVPVKADTTWYGRGVWGRNRVVDSGRVKGTDIEGRWYRLDEGSFFTELLELEGRVEFGGAQNTGWFASAIVLFNAGRRPVLPALGRY